MRPPRVSSWLLDFALPPGEHGQIIRGDLQEEFAALAQRFWAHADPTRIDFALLSL